MPDRLTGGLRRGDLRIKLRQLALGELPPARRARACHEGFLLGESEPCVAVKQDGGDQPGRRFGVATLPGDPGRRREQAEVLVVAQGRGRNAGPAGQLADGEQITGWVDLRCT